MKKPTKQQAAELVERMGEGSVKEKVAWGEAWAAYIKRLEEIAGSGLQAVAYAASDLQGSLLGLVMVAEDRGDFDLATHILRDTARFYGEKADEIELQAKAAPSAPTLIH